MNMRDRRGGAVAHIELHFAVQAKQARMRGHLDRIDDYGNKDNPFTDSQLRLEWEIGWIVEDCRKCHDDEDYVPR